ncbi:MAG: N-acetylmuramoyl-L-alanine amidase [Lachnospiraceae bacterium]|nr:N-acetylmuramoyl-L-alanine amidase [Lachnospiraceae bacterium]
MRINVHAGHNADGRTACGAIGFIRESTEARRIKEAVISMIRQQGHTVYDCTVDNAASVSDNLQKIVAACNAHDVDLDVSLHFNSGIGDTIGNGKSTGVEVYVYNSASRAKCYAERVCQAVAELGFHNRGVKYSKGLYVLKNTKAPAMLVECCFVDDRDDVELYDCRKMAEAIAFGITGQRAETSDEEQSADTGVVTPGAETAVGNKNQRYQIRVGTYTVKEYADATLAKVKAAGFDAIMVSV